MTENVKAKEREGAQMEDNQQWNVVINGENNNSKTMKEMSIEQGLEQREMPGGNLVHVGVTHHRNRRKNLRRRCNYHYHQHHHFHGDQWSSFDHVDCKHYRCQ